MASFYRNVYTCIAIYIYNVDVANTYIAKHRQSIAFGSIYIGGHYLVSREGESHKDLRKSHKSPFVVVLSITLCSLYVNISFCTTASDKRQE